MHEPDCLVLVALKHHLRMLGRKRVKHAITLLQPRATNFRTAAVRSVRTLQHGNSIAANIVGP